jgi:hypothetical protein
LESDFQRFQLETLKLSPESNGTLDKPKDMLGFSGWYRD